MRASLVLLTALTVASQAWGAGLASERVQLAQRYFRGVYGGDPSVVDELAAEDIVVSYPIFVDVLGTSAIRGREPLKGFITSFSQRWADPEVEFHEAVSDGSRVVLVWSFSARSVAAGSSGEAPTNEAHRWGGITLLRFDGEGKIAAEIGEESTPGPFGRLQPARTLEVTGVLRPQDRPQRLSRSQIGDHCIVDLEQGYRLDGSLAGGMTLDFRIYVDGPCGEPPGTFDEHWIARGEYVVKLAESELEGALIYLADVEAGGRVEGTLILAEGLEGALEVEGRFAEGFMRYEGRLSPPTGDD